MARFYKRIGPNPDLAIVYRNLIAAEVAFRRAGATGRAIAAADILADLMAAYDGLAIRTAADADNFIKAHIERTRKRPPATHAMSDAVRSMPLPSNLPSGAVGIANLDELDKSGASRLGRTGIPYWMAQEFGSTAAIGRIVPGYFEPGGARPAAAERRLHPFFQQAGPPAPRGTPAMLVQEPIEARHFLRDGSADALAQHLTRARQIDSGVLSRLASI